MTGNNGIKYTDFFQERLRGLIERSGMSYGKLAKATGISQPTISGYCGGRLFPSLDALIKLADYFAVPLDFLAGRCDEETERAILADYPKHFMELRRAPYEAYLLGRNEGQEVLGCETPWPYNLLDDIFKEKWADVLEADNIAGLEEAIDGLTERERYVTLLYYRDGRTMDELAGVFGVTKERVRQILHKAIRKLRAPHRLNLILYGAQGAREKSRLRQYRLELEKEDAALKAYALRLGNRKAVLQETDEDTKRVLAEVLEMDIGDMDLSVRSYNCLKRFGCKTLGDVVNAAKSGELKGVRNMGEKSANEVIERIYFLTGKRYSLYGGTENGTR